MEQIAHSEAAEARAAKKPAAKRKAKKVKAKTPRGKGPRGKTAKALKLAARPNGVSRQELIDATGWSACPWRYWFSNPKRSGAAQRFGYSFRVIKADDGVRYRVTPKR